MAEEQQMLLDLEQVSSKVKSALELIPKLQGSDRSTCINYIHTWIADYQQRQNFQNVESPHVNFESSYNQSTSTSVEKRDEPATSDVSRVKPPVQFQCDQVVESQNFCSLSYESPRPSQSAIQKLQNEFSNAEVAVDSSLESCDVFQKSSVESKTGELHQDAGTVDIMMGRFVESEDGNTLDSVVDKLDSMENHDLLVKNEEKVVEADVSQQVVIKDDVSNQEMLTKVKCFGCGDMFTMRELEKHVRTHGDSGVCCRKCHGEFANVVHLLHHLEMTSCYRYFCRICAAAFQSNEKLLLHRNSHPEFVCKKCFAVFNDILSLSRHCKYKHRSNVPKKLHQCQECSRSFGKPSNLASHLVSAHQRCSRCGKVFQSLHSLNHHMQAHETEASFRCSLCERTFQRKQQLTHHMKFHNKYTCDDCQKEFSSRRLLHSHKVNQHQQSVAEEKRHKCLKCSKEFARPCLLEVHMRAHTGEKPYTCSKCSQCFSSKKTLVKHKQVTCSVKRSSSPKHQCSNCDARFATQKELKKHLQEKHNTKPMYSCNMCDFRNSHSANMQRHKNLHLKDRRYVCEICVARFYTITSLKDHILFVHSDERNFLCSECGKKFKNHSSLNRHLRIHSETRAYVCECGRAYKRMSHLNRHMKCVHGIQVKTKHLQRYRTDENGTLFPVEEEKSPPPKLKKDKKSESTLAEEDASTVLQNNDSLQLADSSELLTFHSLPQGCDDIPNITVIPLSSGEIIAEQVHPASVESNNSGSFSLSQSILHSHLISLTNSAVGDPVYQVLQHTVPIVVEDPTANLEEKGPMIGTTQNMYGGNESVPCGRGAPSQTEIFYFKVDDDHVSNLKTNLSSGLVNSPGIGDSTPMLQSRLSVIPESPLPPSTVVTHSNLPLPSITHALPLFSSRTNAETVSTSAGFKSNLSSCLSHVLQGTSDLSEHEGLGHPDTHLSQSSVHVTENLPLPLL